MNVQSLVGLILEACRFSKSSYAFEFSGKIDGRFASVLVSTPFSLAFGEEQAADTGSSFSQGAWKLLEREVTDIEIREDEFQVEFKFGEHGRFTVWSEGPPEDNLLVVSHDDGGTWFTVL